MTYRVIVAGGRDFKNEAFRKVALEQMKLMLYI